MIAIEDVLVNPTLKDQFIKENQRLVTMVLKRYFSYVHNTDSYDDYFQVGSMGLVKATHKFNPELGNTFSTYAVPMILGEINRYRRDYDSSVIKVSRSAKDLFYGYLQMKDSGKSDKEICEELNIEITKLNQIINSMHHPSSTDQSIDEEKDISYINSLSDGYNLEEDVIAKISVKEKLMTMKASLGEKEWKALLLTIKGKNQCQIAEKINTSQAHVSRILVKVKNIYKQFEKEDKFTMSNKLHLTTEQLLEDCKQYGTDLIAAQKIAEKHGLNSKQILNLIMNRGIKKLMQESPDFDVKARKIERTEIQEKFKPIETEVLTKRKGLKAKALISQEVNGMEYELLEDVLRFSSNGVYISIKWDSFYGFIEDLKDIEHIKHPEINRGTA